MREEAFTKLVATVGSAVVSGRKGRSRTGTSPVANKGWSSDQGARDELEMELFTEVCNYWLIFGLGTPKINII